MSLLLLESLSGLSVVLEIGNSHFKCTRGMHHTFYSCITITAYISRYCLLILLVIFRNWLPIVYLKCILFLFWYQTRKSHPLFYENCMQRNWAPLAIAKWIFDYKCIISKSTDTSTSRIKVFLCDFMVTLLFLMICALTVKHNQCANSIVFDDGIYMYILSKRFTWLLS